jgi:hypothetical protein
LEVCGPEVDDIQTLLGAGRLVWVEDADPRRQGGRSLATASDDVQPRRGEVVEVRPCLTKELLSRCGEAGVAVVALSNCAQVGRKVDTSEI